MNFAVDIIAHALMYQIPNRSLLATLPSVISSHQSAAHSIAFVLLSGVVRTPRCFVGLPAHLFNHPMLTLSPIFTMLVFLLSYYKVLLDST